MKDLNLPAAAVPLDHLMCLIKGSHWRIGEQQPLDGLVAIGWRVFLPYQDGVERNRRQLQAVRTPGWFQCDGGEAHRHSCLAGLALVVARNMHTEMADDRLSFHFGPQLSDLIIEQKPV